ncbi:Y-family DNA polymerase [Zooshikella harenae]|uniref:Y-family DNA polymerase n=1 Tax=Zooshikella harenae TaxID=2827238 RepID=A0ABS5Z9R8_9GAMM|nr:Y-family DNA polymerase [Zooshikella harenae]MBU2710798.1 Y-family DNA polymerase [Zooshikella harenae]
MTIALCDANNFYASCERVFRPDLADHPIVILSNNDGCIVARSAEAKALSIGMGVPVFKARDIIQQHNVAVFSSNYSLYGAMSQRLMSILESFIPYVEVYSIDEAFLDLTNLYAGSSSAILYGQQIRVTLAQYCGLPMSIGIAPTKTLAKLANHYAKQHPEYNGVYEVQPGQETMLLKAMPLGEVWGVGRQLSHKLQAMGLSTAYDLACIPPKEIRKRFNVLLERTVRELNGEPCIELIHQAPDKQQIICSRSFSKRVFSLEDLQEAISSYTSRAAEKLRSQRSTAKTIMIFIRTSPFDRQGQYRRSVFIPLPYPTMDSRLLVQNALKGLKAIYQPGFAYAKAGVMLCDLSDSRLVQHDFFSTQYDSTSALQLMNTVDAINHQFTNGLFLASNGIQQAWRMSRTQLSPNYLSNWNQIKRVQVK